ncbi:unnamed protein product, partial [Staurois parvus]
RVSALLGDPGLSPAAGGRVRPRARRSRPPERFSPAPPPRCREESPAMAKLGGWGCAEWPLPPPARQGGSRVSSAGGVSRGSPSPPPRTAQRRKTESGCRLLR